MNQKQVEKVYYTLMNAVEDNFRGYITDSELGKIVYCMRDDLQGVLADVLDALEENESNESQKSNNAVQVTFHVHMVNGTTLHIEAPVESVDYLSDDIFDDEAKFIEINGHYINKSRIEYIDWEVEEQKVKSLINIDKEGVKIQADEITLNKEDVEALHNYPSINQIKEWESKLKNDKGSLTFNVSINKSIKESWEDVRDKVSKEVAQNLKNKLK